jgi:hypothetical protein
MAFGSGTISSIGGAVQDLFAADASAAKSRTKAQGLRIEAENYDLASDYAKRNEKFTELSTSIKQLQLDRGITQTLGGQAADVAGAGFAASGSALDLMRDSAQQGALTKAVAGTQGLITEEGYRVQATSYTNMAAAARLTAAAEEKAADDAETAGAWGAAFKGASAFASIFDVGSTFKNIGSLFMGGNSPSGYGS